MTGSSHGLVTRTPSSGLQAVVAGSMRTLRGLRASQAAPRWLCHPARSLPRARTDWLPLRLPVRRVGCRCALDSALGQVAQLGHDDTEAGPSAGVLGPASLDLRAHAGLTPASAASAAGCSAPLSSTPRTSADALHAGLPSSGPDKSTAWSTALTWGGKQQRGPTSVRRGTVTAGSSRGPRSGKSGRWPAATASAICATARGHPSAVPAPWGQGGARFLCSACCACPASDWRCHTQQRSERTCRGCQPAQGCCQVSSSYRTAPNLQSSPCA